MKCGWFQAACERSKDCSLTALTIGTGASEENAQFRSSEQVRAGAALNSSGNVSSVYLTFAVLNTNTETFFDHRECLGGWGGGRQEQKRGKNSRHDSVALNW